MFEERALGLQTGIDAVAARSVLHTLMLRLALLGTGSAAAERVGERVSGRRVGA